MIEDEKKDENATTDHDLDEYTRRVLPSVRWVWFVAAAWITAIVAWLAARGRDLVARLRARVARDRAELPDTMRSGADVSHAEDTAEGATPPEEPPQHCDTLSP